MPGPIYSGAVCSLYFYALSSRWASFLPGVWLHLAKAFLISRFAGLPSPPPGAPVPRPQQLLSQSTPHKKTADFFLTCISSEGQNSVSSKLIMSPASIHAPENMRFLDPPLPLSPQGSGITFGGFLSSSPHCHGQYYFSSTPSSP